MGMMGDWIRKHKKQVLVHAIILGAFLLYVCFVSDLLFGRYNAVPGESRLHEVTLPDTMDSITYSIIRFPVCSRSVELEGWAHIEGQSSENAEIYVVLRSDENTYVYDTSLIFKRYATVFANEDIPLDLDWSGFEAVIPLKKIERGDYVVGIYIKKGDTEALEYTDRILAKSRDSVEVRTQTPSG